MPTFVDLFCGAGGASTGLSLSGWTCVGAYDNDPTALAVYRANHPNHPCHLETLTVESQVPCCDLLWASPPCQPFSRTGCQLGSEDPRDGFPALIAILKRVRPKLILIENVAQLGSSRHSASRERIFGALRNLGYMVSSKLVDASSHGVPQKRSRLIIACTLGPVKFEFPLATPNVSNLQMAGIDIDTPLDPAQDEIDLFVPPATVARIKTYEKRSGCKNSRDLNPSEPARTLTCRNISGGTNDSVHFLCSDGRRRFLTTAEAARIQTFPDGYFAGCRRAVACKLIGNAVPCELARQFGIAALAAILPLTGRVCEERNVESLATNP